MTGNLACIANNTQGSLHFTLTNIQRPKMLLLRKIVRKKNWRGGGQKKPILGFRIIYVS